MELQVYECKNCGAGLDITKSENGIVQCKSCKSVFTIPKKEVSPAALSFLRLGEHDLDTGKFDDAFTAFKKAAEYDKDEPEAYWGMALATFKVQYLKDTVNNRLQPICNEISDKNFLDNPDYLRACIKATNEQRIEYDRKAKEVDYISEEFNKLKQSGLHYDCFICVKVSDDDTKLRTLDYKDADDIYFSLRGKGYKPFFSERELGDAVGADYEARILYALYTSECMLIVCHNESYLQTPWVKNEYTRFLKLVYDEEKESDSISIVFRKSAIEKLPGRAGKLQGIDLDTLDAMAKIENFVEKHTPQSRIMREEAEKQKLREQEEQAKRLNELEEQINITLAEERRKIEEELRKNIEAEYREKYHSNSQVETSEFEASPMVEDFDKLEFKIRGTVLVEYLGKKSKVKIPQGITEIEYKAFINRNNLISVIIPNSVISIGDDAFRECKKLTRIIIPDGVTSIGDRVFCDCSNLTSITIPNSVISIGDGVFWDCKKLTSITIPDGVTSIGDNTFNGCNDLESIIIPDGVTSIGENAFYNCSNLGNITLPNGLTSIGDEAFGYCTCLSEIIIPNGVSQIRKGVFKWCEEMLDITIPNSVTSIGEDAFYNCENLESINFKGTKRQWYNIKKGKDWDDFADIYCVYCSDGFIEKS